MMPVWGEITAGDILASIKGTLLSGRPDAPLGEISTDSRKIGHGQMFLALKGEQFDGHAFISQAIKQGACGFIIQRDYPADSALYSPGPGAPEMLVIKVDDTQTALGDLAAWWRRQHRVRVAAITGSAGKTSTKEMTSSVLGQRTLKNPGNFNNLIGLPLTLLGLQKVHRNAVLEMGMNRPGEIARLTEIAAPDVGLITNVGVAHTEGLGDIEGVARAKWELVERISNKGKIVLNGDDLMLRRLASGSEREVIFFGLGSGNDVRAVGIQDLGLNGVRFDLEHRGRNWAVSLEVPGIQNVLNSLAAASVALCFNESIEHIIEGLSRFRGVEGRFSVRRLPGEVLLVDDTYNSNPLSLKAALAAVKSLAVERGRLIIGLAEMMELGDVAETAHLEAGRMVADLCPRYFFAMGNHAVEMIKGAVSAGLAPERAQETASYEEMLQRIKEETRQGGLVFLKGSRRMGLERVVKGLTNHEIREEAYYGNDEKNTGCR